MPPTKILVIIPSLISAASWGGRRFFWRIIDSQTDQYAAWVISALAGVLVLIIRTSRWPEPFPAWPFTSSQYWPGSFGVMGVGALDKGYPMGHEPLLPRHRL